MKEILFILPLLSLPFWPDWQHRIWLFTSIYSLLIWLEFLFSQVFKKRLGTVVFDLGRQNPAPRVFKYGLALFGIYPIVLAISKQHINWNTLSLGLPCLSLLATYCLVNRLSTFLTENGFYHDGDSYNWKQVKSHEWVGTRDEYRILKLKLKTDWRGIPGKPALIIPQSIVETVNDWLIKNETS